MSNSITRRDFLKGAAAIPLLSVIPNTLLAAPSGHTIDTYPYKPDGVYAQIGHNKVNMDVGLLNPKTGGPTIGFYASLDANHGTPFGTAWKNIYRTFLKSKSVHDPDRGTMIQVVNHILAHAVTEEQIADAYYTAKDAWDKNPDLRIASASRLNNTGIDLG